MFLVHFFLLVLHSALAQEVKYKLVKGPAPMARFELPYTMGTHEGAVDLLEGQIFFDPATGLFRETKLEIDIANLRSDSTKRDCHMREALGLDYDKSDFPAKHVCDSKNTLPSEGPNSVVYSKLKLELQSGPNLVLPLTAPQNIKVNALMTVHGVEKPVVLDLDLRPITSERFFVYGHFSFSLKDFGIKVKPFLLIKVKDKAKVLIQSELELLK